MHLTDYLLLVLPLGRLICASNWDLPPGCVLKRPQIIYGRPAAEGNPLLIFIELKVVDVTNVPDKGGSYEMDIE